MQKGLIITCPKHDDTTEYLAYYSKTIIKEAEEKNLKVKEVCNELLNQKDFSNLVTKLDYQLIVFNGHGTVDSIFGYKDNILIRVGENEHILKERIIYARSCHAAKVLGMECTKETSGGCFIGYNLPFVFFIDRRWSTKPGNDNTAKLFLIPSNSIPISLIKGNLGTEAHENSKKQMLKNINKLLESKSEPETLFLIKGLWNNYLGQVILGNGSAKVI